jgi:hypothetical protein
MSWTSSGQITKASAQDAMALPFVAPLPRLRAFGPPRRADRRRRVPWSARPSAVLFACASMMRAWMMRRAGPHSLQVAKALESLSLGLSGKTVEVSKTR